PLGQIARMLLGRFRQRRVELQRLETVFLAISVDKGARPLQVEVRVRIITVGQRACGRLLEGSARRLAVEARDLRSALLGARTLPRSRRGRAGPRVEAAARRAVYGGGRIGCVGEAG